MDIIQQLEARLIEIKSQMGKNPTIDVGFKMLVEEIEDRLLSLKEKKLRSKKI